MNKNFNKFTFKDDETGREVVIEISELKNAPLNLGEVFHALKNLIADVSQLASDNEECYNKIMKMPFQR